MDNLKVAVEVSIFIYLNLFKSTLDTFILSIETIIVLEKCTVGLRLVFCLKNISDPIATIN